MDGPTTNRGLLRAALALALALFVLLLAWRFVAGIVTAVLVLAVGVLLAVALSGPVEVLHRRKIPRTAAAVGVVASILAFLVLGGYLFLPVLAEEMAQLVAALPLSLARINDWLEQAASRLGLPLGGENGPSLSTLVDWGRRLVGGVLGIFGSLASLLFGVVVAVFVPLYLSAKPEPVVEWLVKLFPPDRRPRVMEVLSKVRAGLLDWLKGRLISMAIVGVLWTVALYFIGIPGALFLGILAGLLEFVPYFGPLISTILPVLIALARDPFDAVWVVLTYLVIQQVQGYLLKPLVEGNIASVHPAVVIASVAVAGAAFGLLGALLAVPATVVIKVLVDELWFRRFEKGSGGTDDDTGPRHSLHQHRGEAR